MTFAALTTRRAFALQELSDALCAEPVNRQGAVAPLTILHETLCDLADIYACPSIMGQADWLAAIINTIQPLTIDA